MGYNSSIPAIAGQDLRGLQYKAVTVGGTIAGTTALAAGLVQNKPNTGEDTTVAFSGRIKYTAGGAVSAGDRLTVASSGWLTAASSGDAAVGQALEAISSGGIAEGAFDFTNLYIAT